MFNPYYIPFLYVYSMGSLGLYRGINAGIYHYNKKDVSNIMYTHLLEYGLFGIIVYINPCMLPITLCKELYRLEVNIRQLDHLKYSNYYNRLINSSI